MNGSIRSYGVAEASADYDETQQFPMPSELLVGLREALELGWSRQDLAHRLGELIDMMADDIHRTITGPRKPRRKNDLVVNRGSRRVRCRCGTTLVQAIPAQPGLPITYRARKQCADGFEAWQRVTHCPGCKVPLAAGHVKSAAETGLEPCGHNH